MDLSLLRFSVHAIRRMSKRNISDGVVRDVLQYGKVIEKYPGDTPYPSCVMFGWVEGCPIHVVVAENVESLETIVITVYEPTLARWLPGFERRRPE